MSVNPNSKKHPKTTIILAMTADGKIADRAKTAARFGSNADKVHLESQIALVDGVIFGAGTLRAYGSSLPITNPNLLQQRQEFIKPLQPIHILVSASGNFEYKERFFQQKIPRWLITCEGSFTRLASELTQESRVKSQESRVKSRDIGGSSSLFHRVIIGKFLPETNSFDWREILPQLKQLGIKSLAVLGGGELIASLIAFDLIDELWLTVCPIIFGGRDSPTPVEGIGFLQSQGRKLQLLEVKQIDQEIFLHYKFLKDNQLDNNPAKG